MKSPEERFWPRVSKTDFCWEWIGFIGNHGYGVFSLRTKCQRLAHRVSYEWAKGPIPEGHHVDHLCRNKRCVNPNHLEAVLPIINAWRSDAGRPQASRTHCPRGHEYNHANTYIKVRGGRECRKCRIIAVAAWNRAR